MKYFLGKMLLFFRNNTKKNIERDTKNNNK